MTNRSILQDNELDYLKSRNFHPPLQFSWGDTETPPPTGDVDNSPQAKYRLKNEVADRFDEIVREIQQELRALDIFIQYEGGQTQVEFESQMLPYAKTELEQLRDVCNHLIKRAGTQPEQWRDTREEIGAVFDILSEGLPNVVQDRDVHKEETELADEREELYERRAALIGVLRKPGLVNILEYLNERGKTTLPKQREGGEYWKAMATRELVNKLALAKRDDTWANHVKYELTQRGEAVTAAWAYLRDTPTVEKESEAADTTKREAAHHMISTLWSDTVDSTDILAYSDT